MDRFRVRGFPVRSIYPGVSIFGIPRVWPDGTIERGSVVGGPNFQRCLLTKLWTLGMHRLGMIVSDTT